MRRPRKYALVAIAVFLCVAYFLLDAKLDVSERQEAKTPKDTIIEVSHGEIRQWGCHRTETPLIFVHIGKSGGGSVRARFAASALNYNRTIWKNHRADDHFYPIQDERGAKFCSSKFQNHRFPNSTIQPKSFEGNIPCSATTPIGMALACPAAPRRMGNCLHCLPDDEACDAVYMGHNLMGSEFHWLPAQVLIDWWNSTGRSLMMEQSPLPPGESSPWSRDSKMMKRLDSGFDALTPGDPFWCPKFDQSRPKFDQQVEGLYNRCSHPLATKWDKVFRKLHPSTDYSHLYASLPVHRTILLRDPWSWMISKFFWHKEDKNHRCDDLTYLKESSDSSEPTWANIFLQKYLFYLCGDDCLQRAEVGNLTGDEAEAQARHNLRQSFSVVGLLEDLNGFYDMITQRISYMNMSLNPHVTGETHASIASGTPRAAESDRCKTRFADPTFRAQFRQVVPLVTRVEGLYELGKEVNDFQKKELSSCTKEA